MGVRAGSSHSKSAVYIINKSVTKNYIFQASWPAFPTQIGVAPALLKLSGNNQLYIMLLEKTFHMSQSLAESKARLTSIQSYRRQFVMVTKATVTSSKTVDFSFRGPLGFDARTVLLAADSGAADQLAKLADLKDRGVISDAEFAQQKAKILA